MNSRLEILLADKIEKQRLHDANVSKDLTGMTAAERVAHDIARHKSFNASLAADMAYSDAIKKAAQE